MDLKGWIMTIELFLLFIYYIGWRCKQFKGGVLPANW